MYTKCKREKTVMRHTWQGNMEMAEDFRPAPEYRDMYKWTKEKTERVFAGAKGKSGMHYPRHRGLTQTSNWAKQNLLGREKRDPPASMAAKGRNLPLLCFP